MVYSVLPPSSFDDNVVRAMRKAFAHRLHQSTRPNRPALPLSIRIHADGTLPAQAYRLRIGLDDIQIDASTNDGVRYAATTLRQLASAGGGHIRCMRIEDWPDFLRRGLMLDISRDKVPTMRTLRATIDHMADLKLNELQLYTEHTFAYAGHESVWRGASPITPAQIRELDAYCAARGIELVPNQNSFGHMERWLKRSAYRDLAETQDGWKSPWGDIRQQATTLNPLDPRSIRLIGDLYEQLLPCFRSRMFNVGCDETFELGQGRSKAACERRGVGRVYFDFLMRIHKLVRRHGRRMQFWADIVQQHPELVASLPDDVIPMVWGYESDSPFEGTCRQLRRRGLDFYVCPGTSSWCSFSGRTVNCLGNLEAAAKVGLKHGATGYLMTDWGDYGHRQYPPVSEIGIVMGAALSWCASSNNRLDSAREISRHAFSDDSGTIGGLWHDIGRIHEPLRVPLPNKTALFRVIHARFDDASAVAGLTSNRLDKVQRRIRELRDKARRVGKTTAHSLILREFHATLDVLDHAVLRARAMLLGIRAPHSMHARLRRQMKSIMATHRSLWLARNRPGGLIDSLAHYARNLAEYSK